MAKFVGVDGCPSGWYAVWSEQDHLQGHIYTDIEALHRDHGDAEKILVDIPIGLPEFETRQVESLVRKRLGVRRSSVFPVPCHAAAYALDYPAANHLNRQNLGKGLSKQAWYLCPKIRDVNDYLVKQPSALTVIGECHPELAFCLLNRRPLEHNKKLEAGREARQLLLDRHLSGARDFARQELARFGRRDLAIDDCLDALALFITAQQARLLDTPIQFGQAGVPIQMWIPAI